MIDFILKMVLAIISFRLIIFTIGYTRRKKAERSYRQKQQRSIELTNKLSKFDSCKNDMVIIKKVLSPRKSRLISFVKLKEIISKKALNPLFGEDVEEMVFQRVINGYEDEVRVIFPQKSIFNAVEEIQKTLTAIYEEVGNKQFIVPQEYYDFLDFQYKKYLKVSLTEIFNVKMGDDIPDIEDIPHKKKLEESRIEAYVKKPLNEKNIKKVDILKEIHSLKTQDIFTSVTNDIKKKEPVTKNNDTDTDNNNVMIVTLNGGNNNSTAIEEHSKFTKKLIMQRIKYWNTKDMKIQRQFIDFVYYDDDGERRTGCVYYNIKSDAFYNKTLPIVPDMAIVEEKVLKAMGFKDRKELKEYRGEKMFAV